jgi:hypothetical protein
LIREIFIISWWLIQIFVFIALCNLLRKRWANIGAAFQPQESIHTCTSGVLQTNVMRYSLTKFLTADKNIIYSANYALRTILIWNRRLQKLKTPRPPLLVVYLLALVEQQWNYIVYNVAVVVQQYNYIAALPLPTTMGGVAFSISEVVY